MSGANLNVPSIRKMGIEPWWALAVLTLFYTLAFADRYIVTILVDDIRTDLGISDFEMGLILGPAFSIVLGVLGVPLGWLVDRYSRRQIVFFSVSIWSLATMACGLAQSGLSLFFFRMGIGAGEAAAAPATVSILADKFPRSRLTTALAIHQSGNKLGSAAAFAIGGLLLAWASTDGHLFPLIGQLRPWQIVLILSGLPGLIFAFLTFTFSEPPRLGVVNKDTHRPGLALEFLKQHRRLMIPMFLGFILIGLVGNGLVTWAPTFIARQYHLTPAQYGPTLGIVNIVAAAALILKGLVVDWFYARGGKDIHLRFYSWLLIGTTPIAAGIFFCPDPWWFLALYGVLLVITIPSMMYLSASLALLAPNELRGQLTAIAYLLCYVFGFAMGPLAVGAITDFILADASRIGLSLAIVSGLGVPLTALLLRMAMRPLREAVAVAEARNGAE